MATVQGLSNVDLSYVGGRMNILQQPYKAGDIKQLTHSTF